MLTGHILLKKAAISSNSSFLRPDFTNETLITMSRPLAISTNITLIFAMVLQVFCLNPALAAVQRNDFIPLGEQLGVPVYEWKDGLVPTKAIVVAFHGMTFYGLAFEDTAHHLAGQGYPVYSFDFRGFGGWNKGKSKYPSDGKIHFQQSVEDAKRLISALHSQYPHYKIFCLGESLGSNLALWAISQEALPVDGAILCGLGIKNSLHPQPRWALDFLCEITNPNRRLNLEPYIKPNLASNPEVTKIYLNDPQIMHKLSSVELVKAMVTNKRSLENIDQIPPSISFLIISGQKDRIFKVSALRDFADKLGPDRTTLKIMPGEGHLLLELHPMDPEVANTIDTWLDNQIQIKETEIQSRPFKDEGAMKPKETTLGLL